MSELKTCAYCGKEIQEDDLEEKPIFGKNWSYNRCVSPVRPYHKSLDCHMKDQMGHDE